MRPTLIFAIAALNLLMVPLLHFLLQDPRPVWFVEASYLEDVGSVDIIVGAAAHDMFDASTGGNRDLIDGNLEGSVNTGRATKGELTLL